MRKFLTIILIAPYLCMAQSSIKVNFNTVFIGNNVSICYDYQLDKVLLSIGTSFYPGINKDKVSFNTLYKDRGSPSNIKQHFGLQYSLGYKIYGNDHFDLFGLYKGSLASMDTYFKYFQNYTALVPEPQDIEDYAVTINTDEFGPLFSFDNSLGLLFKGKITSSLFLNLHGGIGFTYLKNNDEYTVTPESYNGTINLSSSFSIGIGYSFKNSKNDEK